MSRFRRPSHGTIAAYLALFVALGGTSYAAITLPKNSVGSSQLKFHSVKNSDLGSNSVTTSKVKNGSLKASDFKGGQLPAGPAGSTGPAGPPGLVRAYGHVAGSGALSRSAGIASVSHPTIGTYCITPTAASGISVAGSGVVATPDINGGFAPDNNPEVEFDSLGRDCPTGTFEVRAFLNGSVPATDTGGDTYARYAHALFDQAFFFVIP